MTREVKIDGDVVRYSCRSCGSVELTATLQEYNSEFCADICDKCGEAVPFMRMYDSREVVSRAAVVKMLEERRSKIEEDIADGVPELDDEEYASGRQDGFAEAIEIVERMKS